MERDANEERNEIIDLGTASVVTQGFGFGSTDQNGQPKALGIDGILED
ncbi:MAG: benenodin family lasso peptide [Thermomicrobiales bacterium]